MAEVSLIPSFAGISGTTTTATTSGVTITATSWYGTGAYGVAGVADKSGGYSSNVWVSSGSAYSGGVGDQTLTFDLGSTATGLNVTRYTITSRQQVTSSEPRSWKFYGWGANAWVLLDTQVDVVWNTAGETKSFSIPESSSNAYTKYKLNITKASSSGYLTVAEFDIFGDSSYGLPPPPVEPPAPVANVYLLNYTDSFFVVSRDSNSNIGALVSDTVLAGYASRDASTSTTNGYIVGDYESGVGFVKYASVAIKELTFYETQKTYYASVNDDLTPLAFDNSATTSWKTEATANTNQYIVYDFQTTTEWSAYSLIGDASLSDSSPRSWKVYASDDDSTWTLVDERVALDVAFTEISNETLFRLPTKIQSRYFRIDFSSPRSSAQRLAIASLKIFDIPLEEVSLLSLVNLISEPEFYASTYKTILDSCVYPLVRHQSHVAYIMPSGYVNGSTQDYFRRGISYKAFSTAPNSYWLSYYDAEPAIYYQYKKPKKQISKISFEITTDVIDSVGIPRDLMIQASKNGYDWVDVETYTNQTFNINSPTTISRVTDPLSGFYLYWRLKFSNFDRTNEKYDVYDYVKPSPDATTSIVCNQTRNVNNLYDKTSAEFFVSRVNLRSNSKSHGDRSSNLTWRTTTYTIPTIQSYETLRKFKILSDVGGSSTIATNFSLYAVEASDTKTLVKNMTTADLDQYFYLSENFRYVGLQIINNDDPTYLNPYKIQMEFSDIFSYIAANAPFVNPYKLDTGGNYVMVGGEPVSRYQIYDTDAGGNVMLDTEGNPIPRSSWPTYAMDNNGNVINDIQGNPVPFLKPFQFWELNPDSSYKVDEFGNKIRYVEPIFPPIMSRGVTTKVNTEVPGDYDFYAATANDPTSISDFNLLTPNIAQYLPTIETYLLDTRNTEISVKTSYQDYRLPQRMLFSYKIKAKAGSPYPKNWKVYGISGTTKTEIDSVNNANFSIVREQTFYVTDNDRGVLTHVNPVDKYDTYLLEVSKTSDVVEHSLVIEDFSLETYEPEAITNSRICLENVNFWTIDKCSMYCNDEDVYVTKYPLNLHVDGNPESFITDIISNDTLAVGKLTSTTTTQVGHEVERMFDPVNPKDWITTNTSGEFIYEFYEFGFTDPSEQFIQIKAESIIHGIELIASVGNGDPSVVSVGAPRDFEVYSEKLDGTGWDLLYTHTLQDDYSKLKNGEIRQFWFKEIGKFGVTKRVKFVCLDTQGDPLRLQSVKFFTSFPCMFISSPSDTLPSCDEYYASAVERISIASPDWECYDITGGLSTLHISGSISTAKISQLKYAPTMDNDYSTYKPTQTSINSSEIFFRKTSSNHSIVEDFIFAIDVYGPKEKFTGTKFSDGTTNYEKYQHFTPKTLVLSGRNDTVGAWDVLETIDNIPNVDANKVLRVYSTKPTSGYRYSEYKISVLEFNGTQTYPFGGYYQDEPIYTNLIPDMSNGVMGSNNNTVTLGTVSVESSSVYSSTYTVKQMQDRNLVSRWNSNTSSFSGGVGLETITVNFASSFSTIPDAYTVSSASPTGSPYYPKDWKLFGWNSSAWVLLDTQSNQTFSMSTETKMYNVNLNRAYTKYKLEVTKNGGYSYLGIHEFNLITVSSVNAFYRTWPLNDSKISLVGLKPCPFDSTVLNTQITSPRCTGIHVPSPNKKLNENPLYRAFDIFIANRKNLMADEYSFKVATIQTPLTINREGITYVYDCSNALIQYVKKQIETLMEVGNSREILLGVIARIGLNVELEVGVEYSNNVDRVSDFDFIWRKKNGLLPPATRVTIKPFEDRIAWGVQQS